MNPPCCWKTRSKNLAFAHTLISCRGKTILTCMRMACASRLQKKWKTWPGLPVQNLSEQSHTERLRKSQLLVIPTRRNPYCAEDLYVSVDTGNILNRAALRLDLLWLKCRLI